MIKAAMNKISDIKAFLKSKKDDEKFEERACITLAFLFLIFGITGMFMFLNHILEPFEKDPYVKDCSSIERSRHVKK